jgi:uncharacterized protein YqjF (DUF2071 family)
VTGSPFLRAEWRQLAMLNFEIEPALLRPFVPLGTELDSWSGKTYLSMVGFLFLDTRVLGVGIPLHRDFEEVNLRFYVRRLGPEGWRRGVVFLKEIVPRAAIAFVARLIYNENYVALPMSHRIDRAVSYAWRFAGRQNSLSLVAEGGFGELREGSEEEFIAEHYWGYSVQRDGGSVEYKVEHPRWRVARASQAQLACDAAQLYGPQFADCLARPPSSAFLAEGSRVAVFRGVRLAAGAR